MKYNEAKRGEKYSLEKRDHTAGNLREDTNTYTTRDKTTHPCTPVLLSDILFEGGEKWKSDPGNRADDSSSRLRPIGLPRFCFQGSQDRKIVLLNKIVSPGFTIEEQYT
ncbi:Hypothetical protein NTJ_01834 [Nesidiocoris tenuis]|uniref:Uncharacterized protein n=1 Tax=Nesidiocoris tenuis TaxID=355587 RepID=A0ABN7ACR1_9HEMI|nr:Hypothetical protein NTJ_01834 [Nesidiocoris tenuis]